MPDKLKKEERQISYVISVANARLMHLPNYLE